MQFANMGISTKIYLLGRWPKQLVLVQNRSGKPEKGPNAALKHAKAVLMIIPMTAFHEMFAWEDPDSKQIIEWDALGAHDENIFHQI